MKGTLRDGERQNKMGETEFEIGALVDLLTQHDAEMQKLFAKVLNLYVSPGADALPDNEKRDRLKKAIEESFS